MIYTFFSNLFFFTATILNWQNLLEDDRMKKILIDSLKYMSKERCKMYGFVLMPNHIHLLLVLENEETTASFQRDFLKYTAQRFIQILRNEKNPILSNYISSQGDRKYQIWERRPYWTEINTQRVFDTKLNYIHNNPVMGKWSLAQSPLAYEWSSCSFYDNGHGDFGFLKNFYEY